ncbi:MAG: M28 family peptidase [Cyclobacteriaceae bacterium]|nr:M28 family peptidase [Cyclobacteriaceae bacterium]
MLKKTLKHITLILIASTIITSCSDSDKQEKQQIVVSEKTVVFPTFNADSAYAFVQEQVDFGPRIPNTPAHEKAGDKIIARLKNYGAKVSVQAFEATTYDGVNLKLRNIMASFNPTATKRILLATHWDTRPWASKDVLDPTAKFDGANDGASGVGVLLEIARTMSANNKPPVGVDLLFFDGEDWGKENGSNPDTWCLGSQYWSKNKGNYTAYYGILLDMVGAKGAQFPFEGYSHQFAKKILDRVWTAASKIGHGRYFVTTKPGSITDDHYHVNVTAKIPMINILHYDPTNGYFGDFHHSTQDNMSIIDKHTLKAVGETVLYVVYAE